MMAGDFGADDLGGPYDLAFLSNVVHGCSPGEVAALLERLRAAVPTGLVAIKDMFLDGRGELTEVAACFGLTMLCYSEGGRSYGLDEIRGLCEGAGFRVVDRFDALEYQVVLARAA